jgi:hypothetical protein
VLCSTPAVFARLAAKFFAGRDISFDRAWHGIGMELISAIPGLDRSTYHFAGITLAIVIPVAHVKAAWVTAIDQFIEVSVGTAVALAIAAVWPERQDAI